MTEFSLDVFLLCVCVFVSDFLDLYKFMRIYLRISFAIKLRLQSYNTFPGGGGGGGGGENGL